MSHFTVMVIGDDPEALLDPYWELDEPLEVLKTDPRAVFEVKVPEGELFARFEAWKEEHGNKYNTTAYEWANDRYEYQAGTGWGYYHNPNAKWDWYSVGGRWTGILILKPDAAGELGRPGVFGNQPEPGTADSCRVCDVDWKAMRAKAQAAASRDWDELMGIVKPDFCIYNAEYVAKQKELHLQKYGTKEEYLKQRGHWHTYALLSKDGWMAPGEMWYWGISSDDTESRDDFEQKFVEYMKSLPKETHITVYDCHI